MIEKAADASRRADDQRLDHADRSRELTNRRSGSHATRDLLVARSAPIWSNSSSAPIVLRECLR
jgi:hypothetical protein